MKVSVIVPVGDWEKYGEAKASLERSIASVKVPVEGDNCIGNLYRTFIGYK